MRNRILFLVLLLFTTLSYQACNKPVDFTGRVLDSKSQGNGEGYSGKPTPYDFLAADQPCADKGANGKPLPNRQIFLFPSGLAQVVREACVDITPRPLNKLDYTVASNGDLIYQNDVFVSNANPGTFDVLAASCPSGRTLLASPVRNSLLVDSLNLQSSFWYDHGGYGISLEGSLGSLPVFRMERQDPNALNAWRRIAQIPNLSAGETYVYSFYAKPDPSQKIKFIAYYPNVQDLELEFDLLTGAATGLVNQGVQLIETKAQPFAGGLYISVYFRSLVTSPSNIGIGPSGEFVGSAISITALQMEKVSNYCAP